MPDPLPHPASLRRLRAARVEDFVATVRELHKQFQWPFPSFLPNTKPLTKLHEGTCMRMYIEYMMFLFV